MKTYIARTGAARYKLPAAAAATLLCLSAHAANLVSNGDFETGDFTGWQTTAASGGGTIQSLFGVDGNGPHNGTYAAYFGATAPYDTISQSLATTPGLLYAVRFYLDSAGTNGAPAGFLGTFAGTPFINLSGLSPDQAFKENTLFITATSSSTLLSFSAYNTNSYYTLDSVSVNAVPEPSSLALLTLALVGAGLARRPSKRVR